jgi:NTE family protein
MTSIRRFRSLLPLLATLALCACFGDTKPTPPAPIAPPPVVKLRIGLALGGGAAKGFAHIGVIKMLEANGIHADVVSGTSAGSVVGALYASGMDAFQLQETAIALDQASIRDVRLFSGGVVQGQKLQDYVNQQVQNRTLDKLNVPFAAVATQLETGQRTVFVRGNTGQAVRASSSVPGVFEPVEISGKHYVDGGVVSPVPVDAARQLGADVVIAVDISSKASGTNPQGMINIVGQSISIMGQKLGEQELARADVVIRPKVNQIGATDFEQRDQAIIEGERAAMAAMPSIKAKIAAIQTARQQAAMRAPLASGSR